jgi:hypothetical protein
METSPTKLEDFPEYREAQQLLVKVQLELAAVEKELEQLRLAASSPNTLTLAQRAQAFLRNEESSPIARSPQREQIERLYDKRRLLHAAVEEQRRTIAEVTSKLSKAVCETQRDEYVKIVKAVANAVHAVAEANLAERLFFESLRSGGIEYSSWLRRLAFMPAGDLTDINSLASFYMKEVKEFCPEALGLTPEPPPTPPEKKPLLKRVKDAMTQKEDDWNTAA